MTTDCLTHHFRLLGVLVASLTLGACSSSAMTKQNSQSLNIDDSPNCAIARGSGSETIVIGHIISSTDDHASGALLIDGGTIVNIGSARAIRDQAPDATVFDCPNAYISPGFVNAHEHLAYSLERPDPNMRPDYTHRDQWQGKDGKQHYEIKYVKYRDDINQFWIELRHLFGGTTTLGGSGAVDGLLKNASYPSRSETTTYNYLADMVTFPFGYKDDDRTSKTFAKYTCPYTGNAAPSLYTNDSIPATDPYTPHIAEGTNCVAELEGHFFLNYAKENPGRRYTIIHGLGLSGSDIDRLAALDVPLVWSPRSNLALYNATVDIPSVLNTGARVALGTDWSLSGSYNMLEELRCAASVNDKEWQGALSESALWRMATVEGAYALGLEKVTGQLAPGMAADLVIINKQTNDPFKDIVTASISDIVATFVDGELITGHSPSFASNAIPSNCRNPIGDHFVCVDYSIYYFDHQQLIDENTKLHPSRHEVPLFSNDDQAQCVRHP